MAVKGIFRIVCGLCVTTSLLSGCAYMGSRGSTRADAARALGMQPGDVIILSTAYSESGPRAADFTLANYTVKTRSGVTYSCDFPPPAAGQDATETVPVCKQDH